MYHKNDPNSSRGPKALFEALESTGRTRGSSATPPLVSPTPKRNLQNQFEQMSNVELNVPKESSTSSFGPFKHQTPSRPSGGSQQQPSEAVLTHPKALPKSHGNSHPLPQQPFSQVQPSDFPQQLTTTNSPYSNQGVSANMYGFPGQFQPPSTTRQGTTNNLAAPVPSQSTATFPPPNTPSQMMQPAGNWQGSMVPADPLTMVSADIRRRIFDLQGNLNSAMAMPRNVQQQISQELRVLDDRFHDCHRYFSHQIGQLTADCNAFKNQLDQVQRDLAHATRRADHNEEQRQALELQERNIQLRHQRSVEQLRQVGREAELENSRLQARLQETERQLEIRQQQVQSKRSIWYETQSARRDSQQASGEDPFISPSKISTQKDISPTQPGTEKHYRSATGEQKDNYPKSDGHSKPDSHSMALIVHQRDDETFEMFENSLAKLFGLVAGWVNTFASTPNPESDGRLSENELLWSYMLRLVYPYQLPDSEAQVQSLISKNEYRHWFAMRMLTEYIIKDILNVGSFKSYSNQVSDAIEYVKKNLEQRGLNNAVRQKHLNQQAAAVRSVVDSEGYDGWRYKQLSQHSGKLRKMFGPLLNAQAVRANAGTDLGIIVAFSLDLSAKMNTSDYSFKFQFPETNSTFQGSTMVVKDMPGHAVGRLQAQQAHVRLSMTPNITIRDDRTPSIIAKTLHKASVLIL